MVDWHYISGLYLRHVLSSAISYSRTSIVVSICYTAKIGIFLRKMKTPYCILLWSVLEVLMPVILEDLLT